MDRLGELTQLLSLDAGIARGIHETGGGIVYLPASLDDIAALCRLVRRASLEIDDEAIRTHLDRACEILRYSDRIRELGAPGPPAMSIAVQTTSEALISAYLRGAPLPAPLPERLVSEFERFQGAWSDVVELRAGWDLLSKGAV